MQKEKMFQLLFEQYKGKIVEVKISKFATYTGVWNRFTGLYVVLDEVTDWNGKFYKDHVICIKWIKTIEIY